MLPKWNRMSSKWHRTSPKCLKIGRIGDRDFIWTTKVHHSKEFVCGQRCRSNKFWISSRWPWTSFRWLKMQHMTSNVNIIYMTLNVLQMNFNMIRVTLNNVCVSFNVIEITSLLSFYMTLNDIQLTLNVI